MYIYIYIYRERERDIHTYYCNRHVRAKRAPQRPLECAGAGVQKLGVGEEEEEQEEEGRKEGRKERKGKERKGEERKGPKTLKPESPATFTDPDPDGFVFAYVHSPLHSRAALSLR